MKATKKNRPAHNVNTPTPPQVMDPRPGKQMKNTDRTKNAKSKTLQDELDDKKLTPREEL